MSKMINDLTTGDVLTAAALIICLITGMILMYIIKKSHKETD